MEPKVLVEEHLPEFLIETKKLQYYIRIYIEYSIEDNKGINKIVMKNISKENIKFWYYYYYCILVDLYGRNIFENQ